MITTRYTNKNAFTIFLPTPRGGQVAFHQGQGTTDAWYSRFIGHRQLSAEQVEIDDRGKIHVLTKAQAQSPVVLGASQDDQQAATKHTQPTTPVFVDEETPHYKRVRGILSCKLCDAMYRTGSSVAMQEHLEGYHGVQAAEVKPQAPQAEVVVETNKGPVTQIVAEPKADAEKKPAISTIVTPMGDTVYACSHPGCDKRFVSEKGLVMHVRRAHPEK